jgi:hypothetical protein
LRRAVHRGKAVSARLLGDDVFNETCVGIVVSFSFFLSVSFRAVSGSGDGVVGCLLVLEHATCDEYFTAFNGCGKILASGH